MKLVDKLSLAAAFLALLVSGVALYCEFFDKRLAAKLHLADIRMGADGRLLVGGTFINDGDYPISVITCTLISSSSSDLRPHAVVGREDPFVLRSGEMHMAVLAVDIQPWLTENGPAPWYLGVRIEYLTPQGEKCVVRYHLAEVTSRSPLTVRFADRTFDLQRPTEKMGAALFTGTTNTHEFRR